jgi:hypothetical protein
MFKLIQHEKLPQDALLNKYNKSNTDAYTDCFSINLDRRAKLSEYIIAFYTSRLFKMERLILGLIGKTSTDEDVLKLAHGESSTFAAWQVEDKNNEQILLCDYRGKTRSWLMVQELDNHSCKLLFGSAVVFNKKPSKRNIRTWNFSILSHLHVIYSKALLSSAHKILKH